MWSRRYACVVSPGASDCGPAALATISLHYGRPIAFQRLRDLTGTGRDGTPLLGLLRAAERLGFSALAARGPYEALRQVPLPAIAHVKALAGPHYLVIHRVRKNTVVVADPAFGIRTLSRDEFCRCWTGVVLLVVPEELSSRVTPGGAPVAPWRRFLGLLRGHEAVLVEAFCCALLMTVLGVATSWFVQHLVDSVLVRSDTRLLNALGVGMVLIVLIRTLFSVLRQSLLAHLGRKVDLTLMASYSRHLLGLPLAFFETRRVGEILARFNDAVKVRDAIAGTALTAVVDAALVLLLLVFLWLADVPLALVATAFLPLLVLSVLAHHSATRRLVHAAMEQGGQLSAHLYQDVSGVETIKLSGAELHRAQEGEAWLVGFNQELFALQKLGRRIEGLAMFVTALAGIVILWYGGHRVIRGALTIGELMFFYSVLIFLLEPLNRLASVNLKIQDALGAVDRLFQVLDLEVESLGDVRQVPFPGIRDALELREVSFRYGCRANVLERVSLRIPAGQTVAILGESGSGKSTLLKLLLGTYRPTEGQILLDGVDLRDYELSSLRGRIGVVSQDPFIFSGTVRENIALGRPEATLTEVMEAARAAGLAEFVAELPERYETVIGERGANLSGGQRQRLAIARALLREPEVLVFDEATSHLDTATERSIQHNLRTALRGKTVVLVAHRLSTVKEADYTYVLHRGRVVEEGTHQQLLARDGWYASLWRSQSDGAEGPPLSRPAVPSGNGKATREEVAHG